MLKALIKKQLLELNVSFFYDRKRGKNRSKGASILFIVAYAILMIGVVGGIFTYAAFSLCHSLAGTGYDWLYFVLMSLIAIVFGVFGSVFNTYASLYKAKDNDLLLSMPVPVRHILAVRLSGVYLMGLMFSAVVIIPAVIVYMVLVEINAAVVFGSLMLVAVISVFVLILSSALGWVVARISGKLKNKSMITVIISLAFFAIYYYVYFNAYELLQTIAADAAAIGGSIRGAAYPLYLLGRMGEGDILAVLIITAVVAVLFLVVWYVLLRSFLKIATDTGKALKAKYKEKSVRVKSVKGALFSKEKSRFLSSPTYMLNCSLGTLILVIAAGAAIIKGDVLRETLTMMFGGDSEFTAILLTLGMCLMIAMNDITAPSISLEGKNLWLAQSLPVSEKSVLWAKIKLHMLLTAVPSAVCSVCLCVVFKPTFLAALFIFLMPIAFALFCAAFGLAVNLKKPNLNWTSETAAVKQSFSILIVIFGGWAAVAVFGLAFGLLYGKVNVLIFMAGSFAVMAGVTALLLRWVFTRGVKRFRSL